MIILLLFLLFGTAVPQAIIETLPGYPGPLPFKLETGYIGVHEEDDVELFYYFIESEGDPVNDPIALWITGGPGCSGFSGLVYEIGPLKYDPESIDGQLPSFILNPYSWTKVANIIFLDSPRGTGFSYANMPDSYNVTDTTIAQGVYIFLRKWLLKHPNFLKNRLYIIGDSYGAIWVPMVALEISKGNEAGVNPHMALEGYAIGNPKTDSFIDDNSRVTFAHRIGLLSDGYYKMAEINCNGNYVNPDPTNDLCSLALQRYTECISHVYRYHVLEPACESSSLREEQLGFARTILEEKSMRISLPSKQQNLCLREKIYQMCNIWANDPSVQEALHVRKGTVQHWIRCVSFYDIRVQINIESVVEYHQLLSKKGYQALVYSGDHDLVIPYIGTQEWIRQLNLTIDDYWRPWFVEDEVAGYTERYMNTKSQFNLTFATVKGGGHTAPEYKPKECLAMFQRFLSHKPL